MTYDTYVSLVTNKVHQTDSNSVLRCKEFVQARYQMIYDFANWKDALDLLTGLSADTTGIMTYPANIDRIIAIRSTKTHLILPTDSALAMSVDPSIFERTGDPIGWEDFVDTADSNKHKIRLFPTPTATTDIIMQVKRAFVQLSAGTDVPILRNIDNALMAYVTGDMYERQMRIGQAQAKFQEAAAFLDLMRRQETEHAAHIARVVPFSDHTDGDYLGYDTNLGEWMR
jgi:hypothetical protein